MIDDFLPAARSIPLRPNALSNSASTPRSFNDTSRTYYAPSTRRTRAIASTTAPLNMSQKDAANPYREDVDEMLLETTLEFEHVHTPDLLQFTAEVLKEIDGRKGRNLIDRHAARRTAEASGIQATAVKNSEPWYENKRAFFMSQNKVLPAFKTMRDSYVSGEVTDLSPYGVYKKIKTEEWPVPPIAVLLAMLMSDPRLHASRLNPREVASIFKEKRICAPGEKLFRYLKKVAVDNDEVDDDE